MRSAGFIALRLICLVAFTGGGAQAAQPASVAQSRNAVAKTLQDSADAWSRGDLAGFMTCYEDSAQTAYVKNTGIVQGYTAIADMYAARYGTGRAMGRLSLQMMDYRQLGAGYGLVTGRFALSRPKTDGGDAGGVFTLVFHHQAAGWKIVYDHTS